LVDLKGRVSFKFGSEPPEYPVPDFLLVRNACAYPKLRKLEPSLFTNFIALSFFIRGGHFHKSVNHEVQILSVEPILVTFGGYALALFLKANEFKFYLATF
jgi:hypothetical protein